MQGTSVFQIILRASPENSAQRMNIRNDIGRSVTVFREPRRRKTHIKHKERQFYASQLIFQSIFWSDLLNHVTILCIKVGKIGFLGKN